MKSPCSKYAANLAGQKERFQQQLNAISIGREHIKLQSNAAARRIKEKSLKRCFMRHQSRASFSGPFAKVKKRNLNISLHWVAG